MNPEFPFSPRIRILHVEDNLKDAELIHEQIAGQWPDCEITRVDTRQHFLSALRGEEFDLILSDFTLPAFNGMDALTLARDLKSSTPFIFLSGTIGEDNAVAALRCGAADYLMKDRPGRLIPAIKNALDLKREQALWLQAEQRLHEHAELLDKASEAICVADMEGRITYWNRSAATLFGWEEDEGRHVVLRDLFGRFNEARVTDALRELLMRGACTREITFTGSRQQFRHLECRWTLVRDDDGAPKSMLMIIADITSNKHLEAQLLRSQRIEGIGTLAGGIAHDLNNVLTPILMTSELLIESATDPDVKKMAELMNKSAQHGSRLIKQVLSFARGEEGERVETSVKKVLADVVLLLRDTLPPKITLDSELPENLAPVLANATQLSQVLMNLAVNARDAMQDGGLLTLTAKDVVVDKPVKGSSGTDVQPGAYVLISVSDTGSGIAPELLERIFDPFFTTKEIGKGTGLGLSTALGIVKRHGGFMTVESAVGRGTEFLIHLPAAVARDVPREPVREGLLTRGHGETILVIDDDKNVRELMKRVFSVHGYKVVTAEDGFEGLEAFRLHRRDIGVVVVDMMMPVMSGDEVVRKIEALDPKLGFVVMSGMPLSRTGLVEKPGHLIFLQKPMTVRSMLESVRSLLQPKTGPDRN